MPRTPGEDAVWLGWLGKVVGMLLSTFKLEVLKMGRSGGSTLYLPLNVPRLPR